MSKSKKLKSYHFDCGDSNDGPVGLCARVRASSESEAVQVLRGFLLEETSLVAAKTEVSGNQVEIDLGISDEAGAVEYICVYVNLGNVKESDIDDWDEEGLDQNN